MTSSEKITKIIATVTTGTALAATMLTFASQAFAWSVSLHASEKCENNQIIVSASLTSNEPHSVIIHVDATDSFGGHGTFQVAGGQTGSVTFSTNRTAISSDSIKMKLTWNKDSSVDYRTISVGGASCPTPTPTPTPTATPTPTPTSTPTPTPTSTPTPTPTSTPTPTVTPTPTTVVTPTPTQTPSQNVTVNVNQQQQQQQEVLAASVAPAVQTTQLPSTGAGADILLSLAGLLPLGWKLKKFA